MRGCALAVTRTNPIPPCWITCYWNAILYCLAYDSQALSITHGTRTCHPSLRDPAHCATLTLLLHNATRCSLLQLCVDQSAWQHEGVCWRQDVCPRAHYLSAACQAARCSQGCCQPRPQLCAIAHADGSIWLSPLSTLQRRQQRPVRLWGCWRRCRRRFRYHSARHHAGSPAHARHCSGRGIVRG